MRSGNAPARHAGHATAGRQTARVRLAPTDAEAAFATELAGRTLELLRANPSPAVEELAALMRQLLARRSARRMLVGGVEGGSAELPQG